MSCDMHKFPALQNSLDVLPLILSCLYQIRTQTALHAESSRRQWISTASSFLSLSSFPTLTNAADATSYATSIEQSTNLLSQSLGHAILVIDGMNNQAKRLGSSPSPAHPIAVLDGLHAQAKRLTHDLDTSKSVLESIKDQAKEITINDEKLGMVGVTIAHTARKVRVYVFFDVNLCINKSSLGNLDTSFELGLSFIYCLCISHVLTKVAISSLSSS